METVEPPPLEREAAIALLDPAARDRLIATIAEAKAAATNERLAETFNPAAAFAALPRRTDEEIAAWTWREDILPRLRAAGLEARYWRDIQIWTKSAQAKVFARLRALCCGNGAIVALTGPRGTGKTTLAAQMIVERAKDETLPPWDRQPPYRKLVDLIARYKPLYADFGGINTDSLMTSRDHFCSSPALVVIDEIHECDDQKLKSRVLTDLLDRRYSAKRDTVLISNQTPEDFQASTSDSILSRLSEHGCIIPCEWASWRVKP